MRRKLFRVLIPAVVPVALGVSAGFTPASATTGHDVSLAPAVRSSGMPGVVTARSSVTVVRGGKTIHIDEPIGNEYCYKVNSPWACLNSWSGGPYVNVFTGGPTGATNNYFTIGEVGNSSSYVIQDTGDNSSPWLGDCIGDASNVSGNANTSLDPCVTGWGTNFTIDTKDCPNGESVAFKNNHWGGYLGPASNWTNGSPFYLNKQTPYCFGVYT